MKTTTQGTRFLFVFATYFVHLLFMSVSVAEAIPKPTDILPGNYVFSGEVVYLQTRIQENVYRLSSQGEARFQQLMSLGYQCENRHQGHWACIRFHKKGPLKSNQQKMVAQNEDLIIRVEPRKGEPKLISEAEMLITWRIPQKVTWGDLVFNDFEQAQTRHGEAAWFERDPIHRSFNIQNSNTVSLRLTPTTTDRQVLTTDYFDLFMIRN